jgi:hypothetical protein
MFHTKTVLEPPGAGDYPAWKKRHVDAWNHPQKNSEIAVKQMLQGYASMADQFNEQSGNEDEGGIGRDGYFGDHARDILRAVNAYLSMGGPTRLDSGAVHRLIRDLAEASGVNPDEI